MNQEWIDRKTKEALEEKNWYKIRIRDEFKKIYDMAIAKGENNSIDPDEFVTNLLSILEKNSSYDIVPYSESWPRGWKPVLSRIYREDPEFMISYATYLKLCENFLSSTDYNAYADSEPVQFDGDIIITDPCYLARDDEYEKLLKNHHFNSVVSFNDDKSLMFRDTLYGDWSCSTYDGDKHNIGSFCADAGLVGVTTVEAAKRLGYDYEDVISKEWVATVITNFHGKIWFEVEFEEGISEDGTAWADASVRVRGEGTKEGKPFSFVTEQTGF